LCSIGDAALMRATWPSTEASKTAERGSLVASRGHAGVWAAREAEPQRVASTHASTRSD
jgi:hypothetical protein